MAKVSAHKDVLGAFRFKVDLEINGVIVAGFSDVSGLQVETELEEYSEGGLNEYVHRFPKRMKYSPITLKRGMVSSNDLWNWYQAFMGGSVKRLNGSIILNKPTGAELGRWNFFNAYPVKWVGPDLSAGKSDVAVETVEIVHNGLKAIFAPA